MSNILFIDVTDRHRPRPLLRHNRDRPTPLLASSLLHRMTNGTYGLSRNSIVPPRLSPIRTTDKSRIIRTFRIWRRHRRDIPHLIHRMCRQWAIISCIVWCGSTGRTRAPWSCPRRDHLEVGIVVAPPSEAESEAEEKEGEDGERSDNSSYSDAGFCSGCEA